MIKVYSPTLISSVDYEIVVPFDCDYMRIINGGGGIVVFRADLTSGEEITIGVGEWDYFSGQFPRQLQTHRFMVNTIAGYMRAQSGSFPAWVHFVR